LEQVIVTTSGAEAVDETFGPAQRSPGRCC